MKYTISTIILFAWYVIQSLTNISAFASSYVNSTTGSFVDGGTVTISGSDFSQMNGTIVSWDNFEAHSDGTNIAGASPIIGPAWQCQYGYDGDGAEFDNLRAHSGSISARIDWSIDNHTIRAFGWSSQGPYSQLYITYLRYMQGDYSDDILQCQTSDGYNCNHKQFYLFGNASGDKPQGMPLMPAKNDDWAWYNNSAQSGSTAWNNKGWTYDNTKEQFQRWEFWVKLNNPWTESNGIIKVWLDCEVGIDKNDYRHAYIDGKFVDFRLGHMAQGFTSTAKAWFDDLYIATTQARVEIGNNASWTNCTHREIQIPSAWSDNSINITVNLGSFKNGETAYLFVVDADGNESDGYGPITIGGGGGDNLPNVIITSPTTGNTYSTSESSINIAGTASGDNSISSVTWRIGSSQSQSASNDSGDWTSWSVSNILLEEGDNLITVIVTDSGSQTFTYTITVTYSVATGMSAPTGLRIPVWKATQQMGDD
jgi:hypothetical protein